MHYPTKISLLWISHYFPGSLLQVQLLKYKPHMNNSISTTIHHCVGVFSNNCISHILLRIEEIGNTLTLTARAQFLSLGLSISKLYSSKVKLFYTNLESSFGQHRSKLSFWSKDGSKLLWKCLNSGTIKAWRL